MRDFPHDRMVQAVHTATKELSDVCDISFQQVNYRGARIRIRFLPQDQMTSGALGLANTGGDVRINSTRDVGLLRNPDNRVPIFVVAHEFCHVLGIRGHLDPVQHKGCMMSAAGGIWMCPVTALELQRRYGQPSRPFYPPERVELGDTIRRLVPRMKDLREERERLIKARNRETVRSIRQAAQANVLKNLRLIESRHAELSAASNQWHRVNNKWKHVPMVG